MTSLRFRAETDITKVTLGGVPDRPGIAAELFGRLGSEGFSIELMVATGSGQGKADISFVIIKDELEAISKVLERLKGELGANSISDQPNVALVGISGHDLNKKPGIAGRMFQALSKHGINIDMISTSLSSVFCTIDERMVGEAEKAIREEFSITE